MHVIVLFTLLLYLSTAAQPRNLILEVAVPISVIVSVLVLGVLIYLWRRRKKSHTARADQARADPDKTSEGMYQKNSELSTCAMLKLHVGKQT